jgi:hypothetical protein
MDSCLSKAVRNFVDFKLQLDRELAQFSCLTAWQQRRKQNTGIQRPEDFHFYGGAPLATHPMDFVQFALPFSSPAIDHARCSTTWVDPAHVIGGTWRTHVNEGLTPEELMDSLDRLAEPGRIDSGTARYAQIGSLPLYLAIEGKNRVAPYRKAQRTIRTQGLAYPWPPPEDMKIRRAWPSRLLGLWHNGKFRLLPFPEATLPLLRAYGVESERALWYFGARTSWIHSRMRITGSLMMK